MASTTKKGSKNKKARLRRPEMKTSVAEQAQTIAELRRELEARNRDLAALYDVTAAASQSLEIKPVLEEVVKKITDIFGFDSVSVFLFDPKNEVLNLMAAAGIHEIQALPRAFRRGRGLTGRVAESGQYLIFEDVRSDPRYQQMTENNAMQRMGDCFIAIFPIKAKEKFLGTINCINTEPRKPTTGEIRLINSMADQIGVAVENINLFEEVKNKTKDLESSNAELREALKHQTATAEVLGIISRSPTDVQPVLDAIVESAARVCGIDDVVLRLHEGNAMVLRAHFGPVASDRIEISMDEPRQRWIKEHGTLHVSDVREQNDIQMVDSTGGRWRTLLAAPLRLQGELIGTLGARRTEVRPFTPAQIKLLETFADQAVIAIENVRLFRELTEALEQQTATSEILGVIASSPTDIQPVLDVIAENAARVCGSYDAVIRLVEGNVLRLAAHYGPVEPGFGLERPLLPGTASGRAIIERQTIHIPDIQAESERFPDSLHGQPRGIRTFLVTPLLREGASLGVITIRRTEVKPFTDKQVALLETFANQAVIAIENVRLFKELGERNAELREALEHQTATAEVLGIISRSPTDVQPVLDAIVESAARVCGIDDVVLRLRDGDNLVPRAHLGPIPIVRGQMAIDAPEFRWIREHGTLHVPDVRAQNDFPMLGSASGYRTLLAGPLRQQGEFLGLLIARRMEVRPFTPAQIKLLETFADQAVIAIENVRLFNELKEALEQQTATSEILGVIASSPTDIQPVLDVVAKNAARLCEAKDAVISRVDGDVSQRVAIYGSIPVPATSARITRGHPMGRAVIDRQTVHIHDLAAAVETEFPESKSRQSVTGARTVLATPLLREGVPIGAIFIRRTEVRPFTEKQIALLKTFADQAVIAIENVRLFQELKESLEQQTATSEILGVIASSPTDIQPVFNTILANVCRLCTANFAGLSRYDGEFIRGESVYNASPEFTEVFLKTPFKPGPEGPARKAALERCIVHVEDLLAETGFTPGILRIERARTVLAVPLLKEGALVGVLSIWRREVHPFTDNQIALLKTFADQAVIAIENVRLFKELQVRNRDLTEALEQQTATSEILRVISSSPTDLQPVFQTILDNAVRLCEAQNGAMFRFDGETLRGVALYNVAPAMEAYALGTPFRPGRESAVRRVALERRLVHVPDVLADPELTAYRTGPYRDQGMRSVLAVPLLKENDLIGTIVIHRKEVRPFTDKQIALLKTFADQAVIAIENVRLFQELKEALEQQTATSEILGVIASSPTDIQPVLDAIAQSAARVCGSDDATIRLLEGDEMFLAAHFGTIPPPGPGRGSLRWRSVGNEALLQRRTIHIPDLQAVAERFPDSSHIGRGIRTFLVTPLLREGTAIGLISIRRTEVKPFTDKQVALLETFASQAVIAIENVRLFKELQERNAELREALEHQTATSEVLGIISRSPTDVQPVLDSIVESAAKVCGIDDVVLRLRNGEVNVARAHFGSIPVPVDREEISIDRPHIRWIREHGTLHIPDVVEKNDFQILGISGARTFLIVPLLQQDELIGALTARRMEVRPFTPAQIKLLETFANQAVIALENVRLFQELKESLEQQTATSEILGVIASSPTDIQPVLAVVAENAARLCEANDALIYRESEGYAHLAAQFGAIPVSMDRMPISRGWVGGRVMIDRHTIHVDDVLAEIDIEFPEARPLQQAAGVHTVLGTPLLRQGEPIGAIVIRRKEVRPFTDKLIKLLETFADQAVIAIENVRLVP